VPGIRHPAWAVYLASTMRCALTTIGEHPPALVVRSMECPPGGSVLRRRSLMAMQTTEQHRRGRVPRRLQAVI
jgi:hypothetical protein